jgi:hypothetical protein
MAPSVTGTFLPWEEDARQSVERTFARELAPLDQTLKLAIKLPERNASVDVTPSRTKSRNSVFIVMALYCKAIKTTRAIRLAASPALAEDGLVLCRTLLETAVAILYILQRNTPRRADEYLAHVLMRTKKIMEKWKETPGLRRWATRIEGQTDSHLPPYRYLGEARLKQLRHSYSGQTIERTFRRVGLNRTYQEFYLFVSAFQHVSDVSRHIDLGEKGPILLPMGSNDPGQMRVLLDMTNRILWTVMQRVSQKIGLGYEAEIEQHRPPRDSTRELVRRWLERKKERGS